MSGVLQSILHQAVENGKARFSVEASKDGLIVFEFKPVVFDREFCCSCGFRSREMTKLEFLKHAHLEGA